MSTTTHLAPQSEWRNQVVDYIRREALPIDKFGHQPRLYALCREIAASLDQDCDDDVLFAAAWMHDLGVFIGHRPSDPLELAAWDHVPYTIAASTKLLMNWGFPLNKVDAVGAVIQTHQAKDAPAGIEAVVLRDADILEQLGAIGALRAFVKVGRDSRFPTYSDVVPVIRRAMEGLPSELRLDRSRELAKPRIQVLRNFFAAIQEEAGTLLF